MGYSYGYYHKTKKMAEKTKDKIEEDYLKRTGKKPEVYIEHWGRQWVVRDFGVRKEIPKKPWWRFW